MTNLEVLQSRIGQSLPINTLESNLISQGLNPTENYDPKNNKTIDLALIDCIAFIMTLPQSVKELDYQLTQQSIDGLMTLISYICSKWDIDNPTIKNKVKSPSVW